MFLLSIKPFWNIVTEQVLWRTVSEWKSRLTNWLFFGCDPPVTVFKSTIRETAALFKEFVWLSITQDDFSGPFLVFPTMWRPWLCYSKLPVGSKRVVVCLFMSGLCFWRLVWGVPQLQPVATGPALQPPVTMHGQIMNGWMQGCRFVLLPPKILRGT